MQKPVKDRPLRLDEMSHAWQAPPPLASSQLLSCGQVALWCAKLDLAEPEMMALAPSLPASERAGLKPLRLSQGRCRYVASRIMLRHLLAHYTGCSPARIDYCHGKYGKPALASLPQTECAGTRMVEFNVSHAGDYVLCAIAPAGLLGIDIEQITRQVEMAALAERFFAPEEAQRIVSCVDQERLLCSRFFRTWTLKEAFVKAIGHGLSFPLQDFVIDFDDQWVKARLLRVTSEWRDRNWQLWSFAMPDPDYLAALAFDQPIEKVSLYLSPFSYYIQNL